MKLIVGLGNPGSQYDGTRHNVGFAALENLAERTSAKWYDKPAWSAKIAELPDGIWLIKPQTFMNESGQTVRKIAHFYKLKPENVCLVYDDRDLGFGDVRWIVGIRTGAHHNGVRSVAREYATGVERLRIGIGNDLLRHKALDEFVLSSFTPAERERLPTILNQVGDELIDHYGIQTA